jgi:ribose-phosphate pyrophosphokinase
VSPAVFFVIPGAEHLARAFEERGFLRGAAEFRKFPDGESYVRLMDDVRTRRVVILSAMNDPDPRLMTLLLTAAAAREGGASEIGFAISYLPYMRQDIAFQIGEPVSAKHFAGLLGRFADWVVTLDPHLHRFKSLDEVFPDVRTCVVTAMPEIARWVQSEINTPLIIGPDSESGQWVRKVAEMTGAEMLVLEKIRSGDRTVSIKVPDVGQWSALQPIVIDDIISTGATMSKLVGGLVAKGFKPPICCCVHPLFAAGAAEMILSAGACRIISCDSVVHASNTITVGGILADGCAAVLS